MINQLRRGRGWVFLSFLFRWNFFVDHSRHYQLETLLVLVSNTNFLCRKSVVIIDIFMSLSVLAFCQSLFTSKCPDLDHKIWNWHARILVLDIIFSYCTMQWTRLTYNICFCNYVDGQWISKSPTFSKLFAINPKKISIINPELNSSKSRTVEGRTAEGLKCFVY